MKRLAVGNRGYSDEDLGELGRAACLRRLGRLAGGKCGCAGPGGWKPRLLQLQPVLAWVDILDKILADELAITRDDAGQVTAVSELPKNKEGDYQNRRPYGSAYLTADPSGH